MQAVVAADLILAAQYREMVDWAVAEMVQGLQVLLIMVLLILAAAAPVVVEVEMTPCAAAAMAAAVL
jgi:hypothetical protein